MRISYFRFAALLTVLMSIGSATFAQTKAFDTNRMDKSVEACTDFFQYANGTWLKNTEIPASESRWGTFNILSDNNNTILREVLESAAKSKAAPGTDAQLIGDFYASCMDEAAIEKAGAKPLDTQFKQIEKIKSVEDLQRHIAMMHNSGLPALFSFGGGADLKNSSMVIVNAGQGGLNLPNRNYYTDLDAKSVETRQKFVEYMTNMFKLLGDKPETAAANAKTVLDIQMRLAQASLDPVSLRNPDNRYNKISVSAAQTTIPNFSLADYMKTRGIPATTEINFAQPKFFNEVNAMLKEVSMDAWKTYLRWMTINSAAPTLSKRFADENFNFYGRYLSGAKERQPRWKTCVEATDRTLGEALGQEYVKRAFKPEARVRMNELIDNLLVAMKDRVSNLEWMSAATKEQAQRNSRPLNAKSVPPKNCVVIKA
jgi:putative endopeptidase